MIHFYNDIDVWELYDLEKDPEEMYNVFEVLAYKEVVDFMNRELIHLQRQYNDTLALSLNGFTIE